MPRRAKVDRKVIDNSLLLIGLAFALGGILKGATGAGAPLIAVPLIAMLYDVRLAVAVFALPNVVTNAVQVWQFRDARVPKLSLRFALAGAVGTGVGTLALTALNAAALLLVVAAVMLLYIGFRMARPDWSLSFALASVLAWPMGALSGVLFGISGLSAPVSLTYLNATGLDRRNFIATVTSLFLASGLVQIPLLLWYGIMSSQTILLGIAAIAPLLAGMPVGAWLARRISKQVFDKTILALLCVLAVKLVWDALI